MLLRPGAGGGAGAGQGVGGMLLSPSPARQRSGRRPGIRVSQRDGDHAERDAWCTLSSDWAAQRQPAALSPAGGHIRYSWPVPPTSPASGADLPVQPLLPRPHVVSLWVGGGEEGRAHAVLRELVASDGALAVGGPVLGVPKRFYAPGTLTAALDGQEAGGCQPAQPQNQRFF